MVLTESFQKLKRGDSAPDFQLTGVDGKEYSLKDFEGKQGLLVIFMCNHCPYVKAKIGAIVELHKKWGDRIAFAGINSNDPEYEGEGMENMKIFAKERGIVFPYLLDETQEIVKAYGATCTPDPFLFTLSEAEEFKLVFHGRINDGVGPDGPVTENTMDENISKMLSGEAISEEFKPSMGCSIKWKAE